MPSTTIIWRARGRLATLATLVTIVAFAPGAGLAVRLLAQEGSPARGHAQVVAQGVALLPAGEVVWRVAYHEAKAPDDAPRVLRDLGFVVADQGPILLTDERGDDATQSLLEPGEAAFVRADTPQRRATRGGRPVGYYALELVPAAEATEVGTGIAVFASPPFEAPEPRREHDLDLVRDVLATDETVTLPAGEGPTLVVATVGSLTIEAGDESSPLKVGEAAVFADEITLRAEGIADAAFVAAVIGRAVDDGGSDASPVASPAATPAATPDATPTAEEGTGSIAVTLLACPPETTPASFNPDQCDPDREAVDLEIAVLGSGDNQRDLEDAAVAAATATWERLPFGNYLLRATGFGDGTGRFFVAGLEGLNSAPEAGYTAGPNEGYQVPLAADSPTYRLDVYVFAATDDGAVAYEVFACPPGVAFDGFDPAVCAPATEGAAVALTGGDLAAPLTPADAAPDADGRPAWAGLPPGEYVFSHGLPPGFTTYAIPESATVALLPDGSGYAVTIAAGAPPVVLSVFDVQPAPPAPVPTEGPPVEPEPEPAPEPTTIPVPVIDTDGDGLTDDEEVAIYGTDPGLFDTDGDGASDFAEVAAGTDPLDPASLPAPPAA